MLIKVSEATPLQLDYMVAYILGVADQWRFDAPFFWDGVPCIRDAGHDVRYSPSTDWSISGPIIEREGIEICRLNSGEWRGQLYVQELDKMYREYGPAPLIAAMRCYVVANWNHEVEIPEELKCQD